MPAELGPALLERLLSVWHALLSPAWAEWLRGGKALRDAAPFPCAPELQQRVLSSAAPAWLLAKLQSAFCTVPPVQVL